MDRTVIHIFSFIFVLAGLFDAVQAKATPLNEEDTVMVVFKSVKASSKNHPFLMPEFYMKVGESNSNSWTTSRSTNKYSVKRSRLDETADTELYPVFYPVKVITDKAKERLEDRITETKAQAKKAYYELKKATDEWNRTKKSNWKARSNDYRKFCPVGSLAYAHANVTLPADHDEFCQLVSLEDSYNYLSNKVLQIKTQSLGQWPPDLGRLNIEVYQNGYLVKYLLVPFSWEMEPSLGDTRLGLICESREKCGLSLEQLENFKNGKLNDIVLHRTGNEEADVFTISIGVFTPEEIKSFQNSKSKGSTTSRLRSNNATK